MGDVPGKVVSVNVGQPTTVEFAGRAILTSIFKQSVDGRRRVIGNNIEGDRQSDLRVHGGPYKAVYLYPIEHYEYWKTELGLQTLDFGAFGENLTTQGVLENEIRIGDRLQIGSALFQVTQPRMPCFKLQVRFNRSDMVKRFWRSGRSGIYLSVRSEGDLGSGDVIERVERGQEEVTVADIVRLYKGEEWSGDLRLRALRSPLHGSWKSEIQARLAEAETEV